MNDAAGMTILSKYPLHYFFQVGMADLPQAEAPTLHNLQVAITIALDDAPHDAPHDAPGARHGHTFTLESP